MKLSRLALSGVLAMGLIAPVTVSVAQAAPVTIATKAKAVKKCTLKKKASCKSKGVTKQKVGKKDLSGIKLSKGKVTGSKFTGTKLIKADFSGATIQNTTFSGVNLKDANFTGATLTNVTFDSGTNLSNVNLSRSNIKNVTFKNTTAPSAGLAVRGAINTPEFKCGELTTTSCSGVNFASAKIVEFQAYGADLDYANFGNAEITRFEGTVSSFRFANFSYAKFTTGWFAYSALNNAYFYKTNCGDFYGEANRIGDMFFGGSISCERVINSGERNPVLYGVQGSEKTTISMGGDEFTAFFEQKLGNNALKSVCLGAFSCVADLYSGGTTTLTVWSRKSVVTSAQGWSCGDSQSINEEGYTRKTICTHAVPRTGNATKTVTFTAPQRASFTFEQMQGMPVSKAASIKLFVVRDGQADQLDTECKNASVCNAYVPAGVEVYWVVTNPIDSGFVLLLPDFDTGVPVGLNNVLTTEHHTMTGTYALTGIIS